MTRAPQPPAPALPDQGSIRSRLAQLSLLGTAVALLLAALLLLGQYRALHQQAAALRALGFAQRADDTGFALLQEREAAQSGAVRQRPAAARDATDAAVHALQALLARAPALRAALADDAVTVDQLPVYLGRLRTRVDQAAIDEDTTGALYGVALRRLQRAAGRVEARGIAPALDGDGGSLQPLTRLVGEYADQVATLRRLAAAGRGGPLAQDGTLVGLLLDSVRRSDETLLDLAAHRLPEVAARARALATDPAQRTLHAFTDPLALNAWSAGLTPDWPVLAYAAQQRVRLAQAMRRDMLRAVTTAAEGRMQATRRDMAWAAVLGALLAGVNALAFWRLYRSIAQPLQAIAGAARATVEGRLGTRVAYAGRDELGQVAQALQGLIDTIGRVDAELLRTRAAVAGGDLAARADGLGFQGAWAALVARFNETLGEFAAMHRSFHHQAVHHADSGLPNRLGLAQQLAVAGGPDTPCAVFVLRLLRAEALGVTLGPAFAAGLVRALASGLRARFGERFRIGQVGNGEFVLVAAGTDAGDAPEARAAEIVQACGAPFAHGEAVVSTPGCVGVAVGRVDGFDVLLGHAAVAAQRAARRARPGCVVHDEAYRRHDEAARRIELALPQAISQRQLFLVYQPVFDGRHGQVIAFEALMRWRLPDGSAVPPAEFIAIAEETGHVLALGEMALREACAAFAGAEVRRAFPDARVSVNVSARQFVDGDFVGTVRQALATTGLAPQRLALELTESTLMDDTALCIERIGVLRAMGVAIYLDDFGTGYSSLAYLARLPVDVLKIDQSFVRGRSGDPANQRVVASMVSLARSMAITPLAEGVEQAEERDWLIELGCVHHQGWFYARPAPLGELLARFGAVDERAAAAT